MGKGNPKKNFNDNSSNTNDNEAKALKNNPLVNPPAQPFDTFPFGEVKTEHFMPAIEWGIEQEKAEIDAIINNPDLPTFENTIEALAHTGEDLGRAAAVFGHFTGSNSSDELRALEEDVNKKLTKHGNDIAFNDALFARIDAVFQNRKNLKLDPEQKLLLEDMHKGYVRSGALLDDKKKEKLREINEKLSTLTTRFKNNTVKAMAAYKKVIDNEADLAGVPERAKNIYKHAAEEEGLKGKWLIRLMPFPGDILSHCENRELREEVYTAYRKTATGGQFDNRQNILDKVKLRHEKAQILGYKTHADFVLSERMAGSPQAVHDFLEKNRQTYFKAAEKDFKEITAYAKKKDGLAELKQWDYGYYSRMLQEEKFAINMEELRPYFEMDAVIDGLHKHAEKLFNIKLEDKTSQYSTEHPDIKVYEVKDKAQNNKTIALLYTDYFARPGVKRPGAWMNGMRDRHLKNGKDQIPIVTNTCNFDKPTGSQPALLSLREVETVFHEFGHGLHGMLAEGKYASQTGTNVKWDFVELPSQLQENWVKKKEVLDTFAKHYKTGKTLPAELIQKINDMETFGAGYTGLRQTSLGMLDMAWHDTDPKDIKSVEELEATVNKKTSLFKDASPGAMSTTFGHLFAGGYAAGYYSYKWAEVLDADVFEEFEKNGLYDQKTAHRLRDTIYSKGGTQPPMDLFKAMMGREPNPKALFKREGLLGDNDNDDKKPGNKQSGPGPK